MNEKLQPSFEKNGKAKFYFKIEQSHLNSPQPKKWLSKCTNAGHISLYLTSIFGSKIKDFGSLLAVSK